jgi:hypothetical protein
MLVMCGVVVLAVLGCAIYLVFRYYNRKISGDYISKDELLDYVKKHFRHILRPAAEERAHLHTHPLFNVTTTNMRKAEAADTSNAVRDIIVWNLRAYRDAFSDLIDEAYKNKEGFDAFWPTPEIFKSKVSAVIADIDAAVKYRLVDEFGLPKDYYNAWITYRSDHDALMDDMLDLASTKETPYDRITSVLDSQFAKASSFRRMVVGFAATVSSPAYITPPEVDEMVTHQRGFAAGPIRPPSTLFDRKRTIR